MKISILILNLFVGIATAIAQNPRIEAIKGGKMATYSYKNGGDSIRFLIRGKHDTAETTTYFRSGTIKSKSWREDSIYIFDAMGRFKEKRFGFGKYGFSSDNSVSFYANGHVDERHSRVKNRYLEQSYAENGDLLKTLEVNNYLFGNYTQTRNGKGQLASAVRVDTSVSKNKRAEADEELPVLKHDTTFFANGRPFKTTILDGDDTFLGGFYYNADGTVFKALQPDSVKLIEFKDNVDCYYGLRNKRGDTVVAPKFDNIHYRENDFWEAAVGNSITLFKPNGEPMPIFAPNLTDISRMWSIRSKNEFENIVREPMPNNLDLKKYLTTLYTFTSGDKHGIVTGEGTIVRPPQYFPLSQQSIDDGKFVQFIEYKKNRIVSKMGYLDKAGKPLFDERFKSVIYAFNAAYFFLSEQALNKRQNYSSTHERNKTSSLNAESFDERNAKFGLGLGDGTVLLEPNFMAIDNFDSKQFFITTIAKPNKDIKKTESSDDDADDAESFNDEQHQKFIYHQGLFNAETGRWLLDSVGFRIVKQTKLEPYYFIIEDIAQKKFGIMDTSGKYVVPLIYDRIDKAENDVLFTLKKGNSYQICTISDGETQINPTEYAYLKRIDFEPTYNNLLETVYYFLAKKNGKWGVIFPNGMDIMPFEYDYASTMGMASGFILIKDGQANYHTLYSMPKAEPYFPHNLDNYRLQKKLGGYRVTGDGKESFYINETGKIVLPPDYKTIDTYGEVYEVAENAAKQKKLVFLETGDVIDFPFSYEIRFANPRSRVLIVKDKAENSYGVASVDGKILVPCVNYGVAIGDIATSTFFVKQDTPFILRLIKDGRKEPMNIETDKLTVEDTEWKMYNGDGKLLDSQPFRFPIDFKNGVGVGMQGENFNLYKTDGSILKPFAKAENGSKTTEKPIYMARTRHQAESMTEGSRENRENSPLGYKNILREPKLGFYTLFYNQGLTARAILTRDDGQILVESGRYDGISEFYGAFALVSVGNKIGLIDTLGKEVIAPQDLRMSTALFMDSLASINVEIRKKNAILGRLARRFIIKLPIEIDDDDNTKNVHPDSLKITTSQRAMLWNLLLEQFTSIKTASDIEINRVNHKSNAYFFSQYRKEYRIETKQLMRVVVGDSTMSFILMNQPFNNKNEAVFHNFYRRNGRWEDLKINDLLNIQGEKRWLMNDLLTRKIKLLKDKQIDCSNAAAFITTAENQWMLTQNGIDFCFKSSENADEIVVVAVTWAELQPFLKLKIH
jgi:hypothetical protein